MLVIVALLLANHTLGRFQDDAGFDDDGDDDDPGQPMGFTADVK